MRRRARMHMTERPLRPVRDRDGVTMASMLRGLRCEDVFFQKDFWLSRNVKWCLVRDIFLRISFRLIAWLYDLLIGD